MQNLLPDHLLRALGWTVLHSLWQGLLISLLLATFLFLWQKRDARQRYLAGLVALGGVLVSAVATFFFLLENGGGLATPSGEAENGAVPAIFEAQHWQIFAERLDAQMPLIVLAWAVGMAFFMLKTLSGLLYVQRLRHRHLHAVPPEWLAVLEKFKRQAGLDRAVNLRASALVKVPMVVGWLKPVVLMPLAAVNHLTTDQVEAVLAHELAHIARHDYLLNLLQVFIEALFYFNPAVWWVSRCIRTERENCCDDQAVALCGSPLAYARALVSLQEMHQCTPAFALSFAEGKYQLLARIQRILKQPYKNVNAMEKFSVIGLLLAAVLALSVQAHNPTGPETTMPGDDAYFYEKTPDDGQDTIPDRREETFIFEENGDENVQLIIQNGEVQHLEIDGEEIPKEDYDKYEGLVDRMLEDRISAPAPPALPDFEGEFPDPPAPPAPPHFGRDVPPPPAPPAVRKITTERNGKTMTILIEGMPGEEPVEIELKNGRKGDIIINGEVVGNLKDGEETVIVQEFLPEGHGPGYFEDGGQHLYFFDETEGPGFHVLPEIHLPEGMHLELEALQGRLAEVEALGMEEALQQLRDVNGGIKVIELEELRKIQADELRDHQRALRGSHRDALEKMEAEMEELRARQRAQADELRLQQRKKKAM